MSKNDSKKSGLFEIRCKGSEKKRNRQILGFREAIIIALLADIDPKIDCFVLFDVSAFVLDAVGVGVPAVLSEALMPPSVPKGVEGFVALFARREAQAALHLPPDSCQIDSVL